MREGCDEVDGDNVRINKIMNVKWNSFAWQMRERKYRT